MAEKTPSGAAGTPGGWAIHALTASGAVLAFLALAAVEADHWRVALLWLIAALVVDGVDGTLARSARVSERLPRIDGSALDLVVDYLTYVFVPAWFVWRLGILPGAIAAPLTALVLVSSLYTYARRDMKTADGYFRGFPALWNIVALYFYVATPSPWLAGAVMLVLVIMTFAPIHTVHPLRVRDYGLWLPSTAAAWIFATLALLLPLADPLRDVVLTVSLSCLLVLIGMGLLRSARGPRRLDQ